MTGIRKVTFTQEELPGVSDIELEVEYEYLYKGADAVSGEEVDSKITLPDGWELTVHLAYLKASREAIKAIEFDLVQDMEFFGKPKQWAGEDANNEQ